MIAFSVIMTRNQPPLCLSKLLLDSLCGGTITSESLTVFQKVNTRVSYSDYLSLEAWTPQGLAPQNQDHPASHITHKQTHTCIQRSHTVMFSMCYPEAENSPLRDGEDLLRDSPSWALPKYQVDGEHLGPLVLGKSPLGLQYSKLTSQPSAAWMAVGGHLQHKALQGCPRG